MPPKPVKLNEKKIPPAPRNLDNLTGLPHGTDESGDGFPASEQSPNLSRSTDSREVSPSAEKRSASVKSNETKPAVVGANFHGDVSAGRDVIVTVNDLAQVPATNPWKIIAKTLRFPFTSSNNVLEQVHAIAIQRYEQLVEESFKNPLDAWSNSQLEEMQKKATDDSCTFVEDALAGVDEKFKNSCAKRVKEDCEKRSDQLALRNQQGIQACEDKLDKVCSQLLKDYIDDVRSELKLQENAVTMERLHEACDKFMILCEQEFFSLCANLWGFSAGKLYSKLEEGSNQLERELKRSNRLHEYRQEIVQEAEKSYHTQMENCKSEEDLHTHHDSSTSFIIEMIKSCRLDTNLKESVIGAFKQRGDTLISHATSAFKQRFKDEETQLVELRKRISATYFDKMKASTSADDPLDDDVLLKFHEDAKGTVRRELKPEFLEILRLVTLQLKEDKFIEEINSILDDQFKSLLESNYDKWHRFEEKITEALEQAKNSYRTKISVAIGENFDIETFQANEVKFQKDTMNKFERSVNPGFDGRKLKIFESAAADLQEFFQEEKEKCFTILQFQQRIDELAANDAIRQTNVLYLEKLNEFLQAKYWYEEDELQSLDDCVVQDTLRNYADSPLTGAQFKIFRELSQTSKERDALVDFQRQRKKQDDEHALHLVQKLIPLYFAQMDAAMKLKPYRDPKELENIHSKILHDAVKEWSKDKGRLNPNQERIFREEMNCVFTSETNKFYSVKSDPAVGIVLGSENSHAAIFWKNKLIVLDELCLEGQKTGIPSYIFFEDNEQVYVGKYAKNKHQELNPSISVRHLKKLIGTQFQDDIVQDLLEVFGHKIINRGNKPCLVVRGTQYSPEELYAKLLFKLKQTAEKYTLSTVTRAVIAVPSYFNSAKRQAIKDAASIAQLQTVIMDYPLAEAYLAIKYLKPDCISELSQFANRNLLVFHLKRSSTKISAVKVSGENTTILANMCSKNLGWNNFHLNMVREILKRVNIMQPSDTEIHADIFKSLLASCEEGMEALKFTSVRVVGSACQININETFTQKDFDNVNKIELESCLQLIESALREAKLSKDDIQDVRLLGLSSRVPLLKERVSKYFKGKQLSFDENPIAAGAAFQAATLQDHDWAVQRSMIRYLTPNSLSVSCTSNPKFKIVPSNTAIPCSFTKSRFCLYNPRDPDIEIRLYEGDIEPMNAIGSFSVAGNPDAPSGIQEVQITVKINVYGVLSVQASVVDGGVGGCTVDSYSNRFKAVDLGMSSTDIEAAKKTDLLQW